MHSLIWDYPNIAARVLATYLIPGCVGRGVRLASENSSGAGGGVWAQARAHAWAQAQAQAQAQARAQARPKPGPGPKPGPSSGPSWAQARFLEIWKSGTWKSGNLGSKQIQKIKILKIKIRSAQNVGEVFLSRKKTFPAPFGALPGHFLRGLEK